MAQTKSAKKAIKQNQVRRLRNKMIRTAVRTKMKKLMINLEAQNKEELYSNYKDTLRSLDIAVSKGILHKNMVARKKSRISKRIIPFIKDILSSIKEETKAE